MTLKITILGCGTSGGVPRIGNYWGACDPANPKNRRRRCAILVEQAGPEGVTRILVDTPPDIREQLLDADIGWVDAVLFTHAHADHVHGIDDLRMLAINGRRKVETYLDATTGAALRNRFQYCFETPKGSEYPPILNAHEIAPGEAFTVSGPGGDIPVMPFLQRHGSIDTLGFRFGNTAYSPDVSDLPEASLKHLQGLDLWIVDALRPSPHPSHFSLSECLDWIARLKPARAVLTHMHVDLDYETTKRETPAHVEPGYDGMVLTSS
ncbi:MBL fold metallo-hydrolase [Methyloligella sp. 2.7D]|uniref:MBL fold metallo-hydrolase n=1 Tax=unclassified Methyloligella TaxID=2625955 RepID=UPI00157C8A84|nr:MBL fold metallo-hydrolase [Methyloligella sp. GL2]QKP77450.1 MBL fold metallo-hydrolase [Methyloligella sp. GL2]